VVLEMRDTGPGIPEAAKAHIFEPFFTTKGEGEGTGLGLSVSYGIVTAHGGKIEVPSTSNAGTTFRVTLPAAPEEAADETSRDSGGLSLRSPLSGIRLLFIDDEATLRSGVQAFGELRGFTVVTAGDGIEGLDMVRKESVDAIVCDLRMPGMDGPAFHERLRRERPGLAARTVFITGDVVTTNRSSPIRQPILTKPFAFEKLEETLVALMRGGIAAGASAGWP
jgi:CheY-like chemotaxis protein